VRISARRRRRVRPPARAESQPGRRFCDDIDPLYEIYSRRIDRISGSNPINRRDRFNLIDRSIGVVRIADLWVTRLATL
jgi:hypothetical protein